MLPLAFEITPAGQPHLIQDPLEVGRIAREAEDAGFSAALSPEGGNDGLVSCFAMAQATSKIKIGTAIAIIYNRQPTLCAAAAVMVQEASAGRLVSASEWAIVRCWSRWVLRRRQIRARRCAITRLR